MSRLAWCHLMGPPPPTPTPPGCSPTTTSTASSTRCSTPTHRVRPHYAPLLAGLDRLHAPTTSCGGPASATPPSAARASPSPSTTRARASSAPSRWTCCPASSRPTSGSTSRTAWCSGSRPSTPSSTTSTWGSGAAIHDGIIPTWLVESSDGFCREAFGIPVPLGARCLVAGVDLVRDGEGTYRVLEDNLRNPSGISYVIENRVAMTRVLPTVFADQQIRSVDHYGRSLLNALHRVAPAGRRATGPPSWCSPRACSTPPTSSTCSWPRRWASSWSRAATSSSTTTSCRCAPPRACSASTSSTAASTTTSSTRSSFRSDSTLGRARAHGRGPGRQRHHRQRGRQRGGRRQGGLRLRARPHPLLPGRGADPPQRRDLPAVGRGPARRGARPARPAGDQAGGRGRRLRHRHRPGRARRGARGVPAPASRPTPATTSPRRSCRCRGTRRWSTTTSRAATSTCARSCCRASDIEVIPGGLTRVAMRRGLAGGELVAGRRLEGHLGAGRRAPS